MRVDQQISCTQLQQCLPKKYRQKLEATLRETGAKVSLIFHSNHFVDPCLPLQIVQMKEQDLAAVTPFH